MLGCQQSQTRNMRPAKVIHVLNHVMGGGVHTFDGNLYSKIDLFNEATEHSSVSFQP